MSGSDVIGSPSSALDSKISFSTITFFTSPKFQRTNQKAGMRHSRLRSREKVGVGRGRLTFRRGGVESVWLGIEIESSLYVRCHILQRETRGNSLCSGIL